jgi:hypothetical protein
MLKMPPKHASVSATLRLADLRLPATGFAEMRWHATQVIEMQQEYHFLSSSRKSTSQGRISCAQRTKSADIIGRSGWI